MSTELYDEIGAGYGGRRTADPRIAALLDVALGDATSVVNVGAGTGSYEPAGREVIAVEPSARMRAQRPPGAAECLDAAAEALPLPGGHADASLAVYTDFHWRDHVQGLRELIRVARRRVVILTVDAEASARYWLFRDYLPGGAALFNDVAQVAAVFAGPVTVTPVPVPHDCHDGFVHAFWRRPEALLDPAVRASMAVFADQPGGQAERAVAALRSDLADGTWAARNDELLGRTELDLGHRLLVWERQDRFA